MQNLGCARLFYTECNQNFEADLKIYAFTYQKKNVTFHPLKCRHDSEDSSKTT